MDMDLSFWNIFGYITAYMFYPFLNILSGAIDFFETDEGFNPLNKRETIRLHGNYQNVSYKHCFMKDTNETCYEITEDYPSVMTLFRVGVWCHWVVPLYLCIPVCLTVALIETCCKDDKCSKLPPHSLQILLLSCEFINAMGFILYVQLIGQSVGFKWKDLTYFYYFGVISPTKLIYAYKGCKFLINKTRKRDEYSALEKKQTQLEEFANELRYKFT